MIVCSAGEALGLGAGVGISVCARVVAVTAKINNAIHRLRRFSQIRADVIQLMCVNLRRITQLVIPSPSTPLRTGSVEGSRDTALRLFRGIPRLGFASLGMTATFGNIAPKSMALQKSMHFIGELSANPLGGRNLLSACFTKTIHRAKSPQQQIFSVLTYARASIENAFFDAFFHEQLVIRICEPMGLIANALKQSQGRRIHRKSQPQSAARPVNLLAFLGKADDGKIVQT